MPSRGYRHLLQIERCTTRTDGLRDAEDEWKVIAEVRAAVKPLSGSELVEAMQVTGVGQVQVRFRWSPTLLELKLTTKDRLRFGERTLNITHLANTEERNREMVLMCGEGE